jgi:phosphoribosylanthranilate isomerase
MPPNSDPASAARPRLWVKVCGITSPEDAAAAIELGADALGFNTWPGSRRYLDLAAAAPWLRDLPRTVTRIALTVNAPLAEAQRLAGLDYLDVLQLHGDEAPDYFRALAAAGRPIVKALRIATAGDLATARDFPGENILLDAKVPGEFGGTGHLIELELARAFREQHPERRVILAGGLKPENVARAVEIVRPYGVDVSSGVERAAARKDRALMKAFIEAARGA